jgi:hypothetical protein
MMREIERGWRARAGEPTNTPKWTLLKPGSRT